MKKEIGDLILDIGKLAFAGLVLAGLLEQSPIQLVATGAGITVIGICIGLYLIWLDKKDNKK